ncbi:diguanylate cyclase [Alteromonas sp. 5E99-2]|uniref:GGDEF domain-containing protein n=1 Tax=Alteromonas sp. 5E99-2 TaxID=2817683 RepID=UPI001A98CAF9|nr:GGDEF domain-containing protein [Alteromonas sp. 5E99-2]MBO1254838.1 diguanylate cyclase [Alteromonas sp. 5E99-2]
MRLVQNTLSTFTLAQFSVIGLFIFIMTMTFLRLADVKNALSTLTTQSVPAINQASKLTSEVQNLVTLTAQLSQSQSKSFQRLVSQQIKTSLLSLNSPAFKLETNDKFLFIQLNALSQEIEELNNLIAYRMRIEDEFDAAIEQLLNLILSTSVAFEHHPILPEKRNNAANLFLQVAQIRQQTRIHKLRLLEETIEYEISQVRNGKGKGNNIEQIRELEKIEQMLLGDNGLVNKKIEVLRVTGRARGRGNFVRNLVEDLARNIEIQTDKISIQTLNEGKEATRLVEEHIQLALISAFIAILISFAFIYYLYRRFVIRLIKLTNQVEKAHEVEPKLLDGNDEIARLGQTFSEYFEKVQSQEKALLELSLSDPLTGIPNRRAFEDYLTKSIDQSRRFSWPLSVIMIDVDYFKKYNDHYGHNQGDECLRKVAAALNSTVKRSTDLCARFGGEEFVVLLPHTEEESAQMIAERLRNAIETLAVPHEKSQISPFVTVSLGVTVCHFTNETICSSKSIIETADKALYEAKSKGRNQYVFTDFIKS